MASTASLADRGPQKRLVLCFDGTGNKFSATDDDTNIVKIYKLFDRTPEHQFHYYQPGIGTYIENGASNSSSGNTFWSRMKSSITNTIDQGIGTSFVHHVLAGYRFLMRYYSPGDDIYVFGFSRGAYTARFLCEMVDKVGMLSKGNEEMVQFAWSTFSDFQRCRADKRSSQEPFIREFKKTFSRPDVKVHFLGLFDCVNSVGQFEIPFARKSFDYVSLPPATYVRHAVSIHERRLKFKPTLFRQGDLPANLPKETLKEVWFAGNHGDVGGGWGLLKQQEHRLSDIALGWMIQELRNVSGTKGNDLSFDEAEVNNRLEPMEELIAAQEPANLSAKPLFDKRATNVDPVHDMLALGKGATYFRTFGWWLIEIFPFFTRLELVNAKWVARYWPPNFGATRDIPEDAKIHCSVERLLKTGVLQAHQKEKIGGEWTSTKKQKDHDLQAARLRETNGDRSG